MRRRWLAVAMVVVAAPCVVVGGLWAWAFLLKPIIAPYESTEDAWGQSAEFRVNCGDIRVRWLGVKYKERRLPTHERAALLDLAAQRPRVPNCWVPIAPRLDGVFQMDYRMVFAWVEAAPVIANYALYDLADWLKATSGEYSGSVSGNVLSSRLLERGKDGSWRVRPGWQDDWLVKDFLIQMGIELGPGDPMGTPQTRHAG